MSDKRDLVVVDTETTGLDDTAHILEVAAINVSTGTELYFVPYASAPQITKGSAEAFAINRYFERRVWEHQLTASETEGAWRELATMLRGSTLAGSNPTFDAGLIEKRFDNYKIAWRWHHRLADLAAYAAAALHLPPNELVGLAGVCKALGVTNTSEHSALGDARATAECFRILTERYTKS